MSPETPEQPSYQPVQPTQPVAPAPASGSKGLSIASLVLAFIFAPVGLVLGIIALATHKPGKGLALAGVIISAASILLSLILIPITIVAYNGVQQRAKDLTTTTRATQISTSLEAYGANSATYDAEYNFHYSYPSAAQMKDAAWIKANLKGVDAPVAEAFVNETSKYTYKATPDGCANTATSECTGYEITYKTVDGPKTLTSAADNVTTESDNSSEQ